MPPIPANPGQTTLTLPEAIETETELDEVLTRPAPALVQFVRTISSPLVILGAGGKMGPTLAIMARRAAEAAGHRLDIVAVSRFSENRARECLEQHGIRTIACDLLEPESLRRLPDAENLIYLVGLKFGTGRTPATTWAINTLVPARITERYPHSRIAALSTGNVYPLTDVGRGGSRETDLLTPLGEYANATVGRERIFEFESRRHNVPVAMLRLYYATELRYGVLRDIADRIFLDQPIELANGYFNCIWQGDANELVLRSLALATSPPSAWNLCRPETFRVRAIATRLGELLGKPARFCGTETATAFLGNSEKLSAELGPPATPMESMLRWTAQWVKQGGRTLGKPTHFEVRDGSY